MGHEKKTPKRFELVKNHLLKICDRGHHAFYEIHLERVHPEDFECSLDELIEKGRGSVIERNEWDRFSKERKNTVKLIIRDIKIFRAVEELRNKEGLSLEEAIARLVSAWPKSLGEHLGECTVQEIYRNYFSVFRLGRIVLKDPPPGERRWRAEDPKLAVPLRDGAAYALREMKVLAGWFPAIPTPSLDEVHRALDLPLEKDIETEIGVYQSIRYTAFRVTFINELSLRNQSWGKVQNRFLKRGQKIQKAIDAVSAKSQFSKNRLTRMYRDYRLIEAQANGQDLFRIWESLQEDLLSTSS